MEERDGETPSPEIRAGYILNLIKDTNNNITNWDLVCFSIEFLASQVLVYDWLDKKIVELLTMKIYQAHYFRDEIPETGIFK
ncbi:MAG TPA: hypothetical protein VIH27_00850 [Nitrososphaerales archaeon]